MYAQLTVGHRDVSEGALASGLENRFGSNNIQAVLQDSPLCSSRTAAWQQVITYAAERPTYRIVALPVKSDETQFIVETVEGGEIRSAGQSGWDGIRRVLRGKRPRLRSCEVFEVASGNPAIRGHAGVGRQFLRFEVMEALAIGSATTAVYVWGLIALAPKQGTGLLIGAIPGLASLVFGVLWPVGKGLGGDIKWTT